MPAVTNLTSPLYARMPGTSCFCPLADLQTLPSSWVRSILNVSGSIVIYVTGSWSSIVDRRPCNPHLIKLRLAYSIASTDGLSQG